MNKNDEYNEEFIHELVVKKPFNGELDQSYSAERNFVTRSDVLLIIAERVEKCESTAEQEDIS